jgi:hypothetical protein
MLEIIDINTNDENIQVIEELKKSFRKRLQNTVKEGVLIIISNFPVVGSLDGKVDFLILFSVKKISGNYLKTILNSKNHYIDNFVLVIRNVEENNITKIDEKYVYKDAAMFDYRESIKQFSSSFNELLNKYEKIKCFVFYNYISNSKIKYSNEVISLNSSFTSDSLLSIITEQFIKKNGEYRIASFVKESNITYSNISFVEFAKKIVSFSEESSKYGILTKNKLDKISNSIKLVDEIYDNVGKSISIISGKAGTGKTLLLTRIIHKHAVNKQSIRFLTFNNLLILDIKQNLQNFGYYGDNRIAIWTIHRFIFRISKRLGICHIFNEGRAKELISVCDTRIEKIRIYYKDILSRLEIINDKTIFFEITKNLNNKSDYDEYREFSKFISSCKNLDSFDELKSEYLKKKFELLVPSLGTKSFFSDYYKILESVYLALSDPSEFYNKFNIKNRYDLLSLLYKIDKSDEDEISFGNFSKQLDSVFRIANWSKLVIIDEAQDFHVLEKEILFKMRGSENLIVTSGGKAQLIRHNSMLDWSKSFGRTIPHKLFKLYNGSYRQKQNIINFVNRFAKEFGINMDLNSVSESKGLGKIIVDTRKHTSLVDETILTEFKNNGEINRCSAYESLIILIPSKNYTIKNKKSNSIQINEKDFVQFVSSTEDRKLKNLDVFDKCDMLPWVGISEDKYALKTPYQNETRILHYESSRGLEAWTCACMSIDEYFNYKKSTDEALNHIADDLYLKEDERRDKYAANWCLMAFTRPIDTLYINLENTENPISKLILKIAKETPGSIIF